MGGNRDEAFRWNTAAFVVYNNGVVQGRNRNHWAGTVPLDCVAGCQVSGWFSALMGEDYAH